MKTAVTTEYSMCFGNLPKNIQAKAVNAITKFRNQSETNGLNFEQLNNPYTKTVYSIRVDSNYRIILYLDKNSGYYYATYVAKHDDAYDWAEKRRFTTDNNQVLIYVPVTEIIEPVTPNTLFDSFTDQQLLKINVPKEQLELVKSIVDEKDFESKRKYFSKNTLDYLDMLAQGIPYSEVESCIPESIEPTEPVEDKPALGAFLLSDDKDLDNIASMSIEKWRVFLHPAQAKLVNRDFSGPYRVSGEAGTGKTVVAMHRAKYLASKGNNVLFTTFTNNLVSDIENNLQKLLKFSDSKRITVQSVDSTILKYLSSKGKRYTPIYDPSELNTIWEEAIKRAAIDLEFDPAFYAEEWRKVASVMDKLTIQSYLTTNRVGRGVRLSRMDRLKVWHVFEEYMDIMDKRDDRRIDIDYATYKARDMLRNDDARPYDSIIIDEGQDISANAYKFFRSYVGEEHENDLFIAGDIHQRIYKNKAVLKNCGINIRGRSSVLHVNYRTTEEIRKYALSILSGMDLQDPDLENEVMIHSYSLTHGEDPIQKNFSSFDDQMMYLCSEIEKLKTTEIEPKDICVIAQHHDILNHCESYLMDQGIECYEISRDAEDINDHPGVRLSTMHRVKGLEFRYIFIISVNKDLMPKATNNYDVDDNKDNQDIEKCLLYVSLTRAQCQAYILSYGAPSILLPENKD